MASPQATFGNGVNLQPSYYNDGQVSFAWHLMKKAPKIKTVRIEIEPDKAMRARSWIQQACGQGYDVIATYHKWTVLGTDERSELLAAAAWWQKHRNDLLNGPVSYMVQDGDTLSEIACRFYGDPNDYDRIYKMNKGQLPDADSIKKGQIINYTDEDGQIRQGVLLPQRFKPNDAIDSQPVAVPDIDHAIRFMTVATGWNGVLHSNDRAFSIGTEGSGRFVVKVPSAKITGAKYFLDQDFIDAAGKDLTLTLADPAGGKPALPDVD